MKICVECRMEMKCTKTGKLAIFGATYRARSGDQFTCPKCGTRFLVCTNESFDIERPIDNRIDYVEITDDHARVLERANELALHSNKALELFVDLKNAGVSENEIRSFLNSEFNEFKKELGENGGDE